MDLCLDSTWDSVIGQADDSDQKGAIEASQRKPGGKGLLLAAL